MTDDDIINPINPDSLDPNSPEYKEYISNQTKIAVERLMNSSTILDQNLAKHLTNEQIVDRMNRDLLEALWEARQDIVITLVDSARKHDLKGVQELLNRAMPKKDISMNPTINLGFSDEQLDALISIRNRRNNNNLAT